QWGKESREDVELIQYLGHERFERSGPVLGVMPPVEFTVGDSITRTDRQGNSLFTLCYSRIGEPSQTRFYAYNNGTRRATPVWGAHVVTSSPPKSAAKKLIGVRKVLTESTNQVTGYRVITSRFEKFTVVDGKYGFETIRTTPVGFAM